MYKQNIKLVYITKNKNNNKQNIKLVYITKRKKKKNRSRLIRLEAKKT